MTVTDMQVFFFCLRPRWRLRAVCSLAAVLALGLAACQPQGASAPGADLAAWLAKPEGNGPFPAVVLLHGRTGLERNTSHRTVWRGLTRHAALLNDNGYVTLIVDSFGPRGIADACARPRLSEQMSDSLAAFDHLASLPFVDAARIGVVGFSHGGTTALSLAGSTSGYAAAVAYYPYCRMGFIDRPVLILIGARDDWTPVSLCHDVHRQYADVVTLKIYPDAYHSFDLPIGGSFVFKGHRVEENVAARRDSQARMLAFLGAHLGPARPE